MKLVSDNGPQFIASNFKEFIVGNGIGHLRSTLYHLATNGEAERFVQTFKNFLKAGQSGKGTLMRKLSQFLKGYRFTPYMTTGVTLKQQGWNPTTPAAHAYILQMYRVHSFTDLI